MSLPRFIPVKGTKLVRDTTTGAILNTDIDEYNEYKMKKILRDQEKLEKEKTNRRIDKIENDLSEIKELIMNLITTGKSNGN